MSIAIKFAIAVSVPFLASGGAALAEAPGVSFEMTSDGPPAVERAVLPYRNCATAWMEGNRGAYEEIVGKMDFRNGPAECAETRRASEEAGLAALADAELADAERRKIVRQQILTIDISIFSGLVWTSQSLPENQ